MDKNLIEDISEREHNAILESKRELGDIYFVTIDLLELCNTSISNGLVMFSHFHVQVVNSILLAITSIIRCHSVQSHQMLRYALESMCLACYSLFETKYESYGKIENDEFVEFHTKVTLERSYKYIEENYKEFSKDLKIIKKNLSDQFSHANVNAAQKCIIYENGSLIGLHFDNYTKEYILGTLLFIDEMICMYLSFLKIIKKNLDKFEFKENFEKEFSDLWHKYDKIRFDFFSQPQFKEIREKATEVQAGNLRSQYGSWLKTMNSETND